MPKGKLVKIEALPPILSRKEIPVRGSPGERGQQGIQGERGERGPEGERGLQGRIGPVGPQGIQGVAGPVGPAGPKGDRGEKGDVGEGKEGRAGKDGPSLEEVTSKLSPQLSGLVKKEIGKQLPAGMLQGGVGGGFTIQDLPGYKTASTGDAFGVGADGKAGFISFNTLFEMSNIITVGTTAPSDPVVGQLWVDTN